jgi:putative ABC transport system substrate-binding protein
MNLRRKLLVALGATALAAPFAARAQAQRVYRVAVLVWGTERAMGTRLAALRAALKQLGYVEGQNLSLSVRWNEGAVERLPDLAAELLREQPDVFVAAPVLAAAAVHKLTRTVPIVMSGGSGAVAMGLAQSLARPGGNVTGVTNQGDDLTPKQMELLKTMVPRISRVAVLSTGVSAAYDKTWHDAQQSAQALKLQLTEVRIGAPGDLARLTPVCGKNACQGLLVMLDPRFVSWRTEIIERAAQLRLPAIYFSGEFAREGGLISYGTNPVELWRRAAIYVDKILKGAKPGELPIEQPTRFELVVNLKTAKALGIKVPQAILVQADEVIE